MTITVDQSREKIFQKIMHFARYDQALLYKSPCSGGYDIYNLEHSLLFINIYSLCLLDVLE